MMQIDYTPHAAQMQIHRARDARFRTVCTGRRFGKTLCMAAELLDRGGGDPPSPMEMAGYGRARIVRDYGWVAPTYGVAERGVEAFRTIAPEFVRVIGRMPTRVEFEGAAGPCRVFMLSADNPDSIRGFGFRGIVVDEAAAVPVDVWNYVLRPTLAQTLGWGVFISTPAGRNWFYDMFTRGVERQEGFRSFTFPSNVSPYFPAKEWEEARATLPEDVFRQEYMAEFLEDSAGVFRGVDACLVTDADADAGLQTRPHNVIVGCDIAKHTDWTVLIAVDAKTGLCLEMERFNHLDWPLQKERIAAFVRRWNALLVMDATGVGDPVYDDLRRGLPRVEGFRITAQTKRELVQGLMVAVEQRHVMWPAGKGGWLTTGGSRSVADRGAQVARDTGPAAALSRDSADTYPAPPTPPCGHTGLTRSFAPETPIRATVRPGAGTHRIENTNWDILTAEMRRYEYDIGPTGQVSYAAPSGYHDDCVMALALAVWGCRMYGVETGKMVRLRGGGTFDGKQGRQMSVTLA